MDLYLSGSTAVMKPEVTVCFPTGFRCRYINPLVTNGLSHPYYLDESIFNFNGFRSNFSLISFFDEIRVSKQKSRRWDAGFCGVTSETIRLPMSHKKYARLIWAKGHCSLTSQPLK